MAEAPTNPGPSPAASWTVLEHTAGDGYRWRYRRYDPPGPPRGHLVWLHGIQSHGGWYEYSCGRLSEAGLVVSFLDRRGAGMNQQARGDAPGFRRLLDDVAEFLHTLQPARASQPVFLGAISWGGKLAAALQRRHPGLVDGLALLCPGLFSRVMLPLRQHLSIAWTRLTRPSKLFPIPLSSPDLFTATPRWQRFIREDPLSLRLATARLLFESVRLDGYLRLLRPAVEVPVLLLLAENDRIIQNTPTRRFVERFATRDKQIIEYAGAHHTLEFEPDPDRFIGDLRHWLEQRLTSRTACPVVS